MLILENNAKYTRNSYIERLENAFYGNERRYKRSILVKYDIIDKLTLTEMLINATCTQRLRSSEIMPWAIFFFKKTDQNGQPSRLIRFVFVGLYKAIYKQQKHEHGEFCVIHLVQLQGDVKNFMCIDQHNFN